MGRFDTPDVGGWSLSVHHAYDVGGRRLYLGNGDERSAPSRGGITTVAGTGSATYSGVGGGLATQAGLAIALGVAVGFDGSLYIADFARIRKVRPDGIITTVAGIGFAGFSGDGGPATQAAIEFNIRGLAVGSMAAYTSPTKGTSASDE